MHTLTTHPYSVAPSCAAQALVSPACIRNSRQQAFPAWPRVLYGLLLSICSLATLGCSTPKVQNYAQEQPSLDLRRYFNGPLNAHGIFTDRSGKVVRRFVVEMNASWSGPPGQEVGILDETFRYVDAESVAAEKRGTPLRQAQRRVWRLEHLGQGRYSGSAADVVGQAHGEVAGNAFYWRYTLNLPYKDSEIKVQFDDWMYLVDERVMLNKATMSKWGIKLGEVSLVFHKP